MRGIWAAALNPFDYDLTLDEAGLRSNIRHWIDDLDIQGLFIAGKQGEFFSMSGSAISRLPSTSAMARPG